MGPSRWRLLTVFARIAGSASRIFGWINTLAGKCRFDIGGCVRRPAVCGQIRGVRLRGRENTQLERRAEVASKGGFLKPATGRGQVWRLPKLGQEEAEVVHAVGVGGSAAWTPRSPSGCSRTRRAF